MLKQGPCCPPIQPLAFIKTALKLLLYLYGGNLGRFSRQVGKTFNKLSLLEQYQVSGNFNSLISQEHFPVLLCPMVRHVELNTANWSRYVRHIRTNGT
jgi:hypothetical protein